jgi:hypothetical protein
VSETAKLAAALAAVQAELPEIERDRTVEVQQKNGGTYSYSYVTLANLSKVVLPLLARHGLAFAAMPGTGADGKMCVRYHLLHTSGESLSGEFPISGEGGIQMIGGRITYARRYCLAAVVGVAADEDDESRLADDHRPATAQRAAARRPPPATAGAPAKRTAQRAAAPPPLPSDGPRPYTPAQRAKLMAGFSQIGIDDRGERLDVCSQLVGRQLDSANDLTTEEAKRVINALETAAKQDSPLLWLAELTAAPPDAEPAGEPAPGPAEAA